MAFRFSLQSILKLRCAQEHAESVKLEAIVAEQRWIRKGLEILSEASARVERRFQQELMGGLTGSEVHFQDACQSSTALLRATLQQRLEALEQQRLAQLQIFYRARQNRQILDNLRLRQLAEYNAELVRKEQQERDEMFLLKIKASDD
jgi:flagellar export protein FliJ